MKPNYSISHINNPCKIESKTTDLYQYTIYIGAQFVQTSEKNSYWYIANDKVIVYSGSKLSIETTKVCVEIYGYTPEIRTSTYSKGTDLPYINGCSTKQLIEPVRQGDPTWQMLYMPPFTSEQEHHIHSTVRVVYVLSGRGTSHIGSRGQTIEIPLEEGMVLTLDKMTPHHFSTQDDSLIVLPLHIFSSTTSEFNHPMYNGTFRI